MKDTRRAGFGGLDYQRTPMGTRLTLLADRPGLVIGVTVEIMDPRAKLPDEIEIKQPSAEYIAAAASFVPPVQAPVVVEPEPALSVQATIGPGGSDEGLEPLIEPGEPEPTTAKVKKSKVATKRLKKVAKEVKQLGVDVDVDAEGGDGA